MGRTDQIVRVLALAHALATSKRGISLPAFAKQRGFPQRSVYNDFKTLERAAFPIVEVSRGRYRIADTWRPIGLPHLDGDEALALFVARQLMGTVRTTSMGRALDRVWTKLSGSGSQAALVPADAPWLSVRPATGIDYTRNRATIAVLERAVRERRVVRARYRRLDGDELTRDIEPGELHWDAGLESLYAIAWCRLRTAIRVFAVHRFVAAELTDEVFARRRETRSEVALKSAFRVWRSESVQPVRLLLTGRAAGEARERTWHASQVMEASDRDAVALRLDVAEPAELIPWLLGLAADVTVLEPSWLGEEVARRHRAAADAADRRAERPLASRATAPARRRSTTANETLPSRGKPGRQNR